MTDRSQFPSGSIMAEMHLEMHASKVRDQITILHDKEFEVELERLELLYSEKQLIFIFEDGQERNLGGYVNDELLPYFREVNQAAFFLIDPETKDPLSGQIIPLSIID